MLPDARSSVRAAAARREPALERLLGLRLGLGCLLRREATQRTCATMHHILRSGGKRESVTRLTLPCRTQRAIPMECARGCMLAPATMHSPALPATSGVGLLLGFSRAPSSRTVSRAPSFDSRVPRLGISRAPRLPSLSYWRSLGRLLVPAWESPL